MPDRDPVEELPGMETRAREVLVCGTRMSGTEARAILEAAGVPALLAENEQQRDELERLRGALARANAWLEQAAGSLPKQMPDAGRAPTRYFLWEGVTCAIDTIRDAFPERDVPDAALATPETPEGESDGE